MRAFAEDQERAGLTDVGREQGEMTAEYLRVLNIDAIYSSRLGRALETAVIISKKLPNTVVRRSDSLRELPNLGYPNFAEGKRRGERAFARFVRPTRQKQRNRPRHFTRESHSLFCLPRVTAAGRIVVRTRQLSLRHYASARGGRNRADCWL